MDREIELELSRPQKKIILARTPRILNMAGQQSGKSFLIGFISGDFVSNFPRIKGFIGANTRIQLSQSTIVRVTAVWRDIYGLVEYDVKKNPNGHFVMNKIPPAHFVQYETYERYSGIISFKNGAIIYIGSLTNYLAHDGKQFGWAHLDETKDTKEIALTTVIFARLSQVGLYYKPDGELVYSLEADRSWTPFQPCYIHTSPAIGQVEWLNEMFELTGFEERIKACITNPDDYYYRQKNGKTVCVYSTYHNRNNLPANYIKTRLDTMSNAEALKFVYGYPFSKTGGEFYPAFDRLIHGGKVEYIPERPIHTTFDFNVMPFMTLICVQIIVLSKFFDSKAGKYYLEETEETKLLPKKDVIQMRFFKEFCLKSPLNTTAALCEFFITNYHKFNPDVFLYGDASGKSRQPGRGDGTNFLEIKARLKKYLNNASDRVPAANPSVLKRRDFINRILEGKYPIEILIDKDNCPETIKDFEFTMLGNEGKLKEIVKDQNGIPYQKRGHATDAADYLITGFFKELYQKAI